MKAMMNIGGVFINVIAESDAKEISFHFIGSAPRSHIRAAENKYLGITSGKPASLEKHMKIASDPIGTLVNHINNKSSLNKDDCTFFRLRMIAVIDIINKCGHVGPDGINISLGDFEPIEQTRICSVKPYDLPKLITINVEDVSMPYENEVQKEYVHEDLEMSSFTSNAMVAIPTPTSVAKILSERCPEHILNNKKWKLEAENMIYERCRPKEFITFLNRCDDEIAENMKKAFLKFNAENELEKLKVTKTSELEKLKVEVEKIKETNRLSLADKKIERVKQQTMKIKVEIKKISLMQEQTNIRPSTIEEIISTNARVIPSHIEGRRVIGNKIYASNEDDLKENDIIQEDNSSIPMTVSKSKDNVTYIQKRFNFCREAFLKSKSNKKTYVLTNNADMHAIGNIPNVMFYGIIDQKRFSNDHYGCGDEVDCALGLFRKNNKLVARAMFRKT